MQPHSPGHAPPTQSHPLPAPALARRAAPGGVRLTRHVACLWRGARPQPRRRVAARSHDRRSRGGARGPPDRP
eukprot:3831949-Prymnesium_polylepis.1